MKWQWSVTDRIINKNYKDLSVIRLSILIHDVINLRMYALAAQQFKNSAQGKNKNAVPLS